MADETDSGNDEFFDALENANGSGSSSKTLPKSSRYLARELRSAALRLDLADLISPAAVAGSHGNTLQPQPSASSIPVVSSPLRASSPSLPLPTAEAVEALQAAVQEASSHNLAIPQLNGKFVLGSRIASFDQSVASGLSSDYDNSTLRSSHSSTHGDDGAPLFSFPGADFLVVSPQPLRPAADDPSRLNPSATPRPLSLSELNTLCVNVTSAENVLKPGGSSSEMADSTTAGLQSKILSDSTDLGTLIIPAKDASSQEASDSPAASAAIDPVVREPSAKKLPAQDPLTAQLMDRRMSAGSEGQAESSESDSAQTPSAATKGLEKTRQVWRSIKAKAGASSAAASKEKLPQPLAFNAAHPMAGTYAKSKLRHKNRAEFPSLQFLQQLSDGGCRESIWTMRFNLDGTYLAAGGSSSVIRLWAFNDPGVSQTPSSLEIFASSPVLLEGHNADILDLSWSKNNFILSSSMDKTVRLWHVSKKSCICIFEHLDFVPSVCFHPKDDRFFLSGSLDCRVRLWNIPEKKVVHWTELPKDEFITALSFGSNGKQTMVGTCQGNCYFFETSNLKYVTQIKVRSKRGKNSKGSKITGICCIPGQRDSDDKVLVSTNDSRLRLYSMRDKSLFCKYSSHRNKRLQIRAFFSDDGEYIISGSEDCRLYIWSTNGKYSSLGHFSRRKDRIDATESFEISTCAVTVASFAPSHLKNLLKSLGLRPIPSTDYPEEFAFSEGSVIATSDMAGRICLFESKLAESLLEEKILNSEEEAARPRIFQG